MNIIIKESVNKDKNVLKAVAEAKKTKSTKGKTSFGIKFKKITSTLIMF